MFPCLTTKSFPLGLALFSCFTEHRSHMEILVKMQIQIQQVWIGPGCPMSENSQRCPVLPLSAGHIE